MLLTDIKIQELSDLDGDTAIKRHCTLDDAGDIQRLTECSDTTTTLPDMVTFNGNQVNGQLGVVDMMLCIGPGVDLYHFPHPSLFSQSDQASLHLGGT